MAKTKIRMQVLSQEVWGRDGQITESISLGMPQTGDSGMMEASPTHSVSLFFPQGEGFTNFPMGEEVEVTFSPVQSGG